MNSPFEFLKSLLLTGLSCLKTFCKGTSGITPEGVALIDKLIQRKVWVDASHANDMELIELLPIFESKKLPLLVTHSQLRDFYKAERGLSESEIQYLQKRDGVIGLLPTQEFFDRWPEPQSKCESGLEAFKQSVAVAAKILGPEKVVLGSDINSPLNGLSPACDPQTDFAKKGFYQYSQWPELYAYITPPPLKGDAWNALTLRHFLKLWKQIR